MCFPSAKMNKTQPSQRHALYGMREAKGRCCQCKLREARSVLHERNLVWQEATVSLGVPELRLYSMQTSPPASGKAFTESLGPDVSLSSPGPLADVVAFPVRALPSKAYGSPLVALLCTSLPSSCHQQLIFSLAHFSSQLNICRVRTASTSGGMA